jgi:hypothetical protein
MVGQLRPEFRGMQTRISTYRPRKSRPCVMPDVSSDMTQRGKSTRWGHCRVLIQRCHRLGDGIDVGILQIRSRQSIKLVHPQHFGPLVHRIGMPNEGQSCVGCDISRQGTCNDE